MQGLKGEHPAALDTHQLGILPLDQFKTMGLSDHTVDLDLWRLSVTGKVQRPLKLAYAELLALPAVEGENVLLICPGVFTIHARWIDVTLPGGEVFAHSEHEKTGAHTDMYVALRDAFDDLRRQLEDYGRRQHGDVKRHEPSLQAGTIVELATEEGYGRIETANGRLVYFHRNSVHGTRFESLAPGMTVRFEEEQGELGA